MSEPTPPMAVLSPRDVRKIAMTSTSSFRPRTHPMQDLREFTRELMVGAERDLETELDWVAIDHWNTDNPHVHVLIRGRADGG
jgi:type IV secretory pathway VirD2 relaxase